MNKPTGGLESSWVTNKIINCWTYWDKGLTIQMSASETLQGGQFTTSTTSTP